MSLCETTDPGTRILILMLVEEEMKALRICWTFRVTALASLIVGGVGIVLFFYSPALYSGLLGLFGCGLAILLAVLGELYNPG